MSNDDKLLHIVSNETKTSIDQMPIVTPSIFASIFSKNAQSHNIDLNDEDKLSEKLIENQCSELTKLQNTTSKNANILSHSTAKAINAIQDKDETTLNEVLKETEELRREIEKLKESVYKDELTNSFNRKWMHDNHLEDEGFTFKEDGTLAIIDLNYFKIINDLHGHVIGDKVLVFIANALKKANTEVIRYGGDEFILLFSKEIKTAQAAKILHNLREDILTKKLKAHDSMFRVSFSIGISSYNTGEELSLVIENADKEMYKDKELIKKRITGIEV